MREDVERVFAFANAQFINEFRMTKASLAEDRAHLQRTKSVGFRVRQQEYEDLIRAAEEAGMPIGEWIREVSLRAARRGAAASEADTLPRMIQVSLEELAALRAIILTLFGTTNPSLAKEEIDQILGYADSVKKNRVEELMKRHEAKAAVVK
jgi:predicted DNA binding CopG/RHH family protein